MLKKRLPQLPRPLRFLVDLCTRAAQENIGAYAASASFFIILAIFPAMMLIFSLINLTPLTQSDLLDAIGAILPDALMPLAEYLTSDLFSGSSITVVSVSAVLAIWSASRGVYGVMVGMNAIFHTQDRRNYLVRRLICVFYTLFLILGLLITLALHVFGRLIIGFLEERLPTLTNELALLSALRFIFTVAFLTLLFTFLFLGFPNRRVHLRACVLSAFLTAVGWMAFSSLFSIYVSHSNNYSTYYGNLTTVALFMLWLYICMTILLYGGVLASMLDGRRKKSGPGAGGKE